jgi:SSS family solute:Na+ symporter
MNVFATNFGWLDWMLVAIYLSASLAVGIIANRFIHTVEGFLVGGRGLGTALNTATYITTGLGLVSLMYISIDSFSHGFSYLTLAFIVAAMGIFIGMTGFVVRKLRALELMTIPEFFVHRFGQRTRVLAAVTGAVAGILNMGLFPKMGAMFIAYATGLAGAYEDPTVLVNLITTVLIVFVLVYTVLGGMVSVIITDFVQFIVLSIGMGLGLYFCLVHPDLGWERMTTTLAEHRGEGAFNPLADPDYGWTWILFNLILFAAAMVSWGPELSRALTARSERIAVRTFLYAVPGKFVGYCIPALWGIAAFCLVANQPELRAIFFPDGLAGEAADAGRAMPLTLGKIIPTGLLGLLVAGLLAAFMSTHDSYLLCWSSIIARDIAMPLSGNRLTHRQQILITRISIICIGTFLLIWGVWYELPSSVWNYMAVTGAIYIAGAGVSIIGGAYWRRASSAGAVASLLGGLSALPGVFLDPINRLLGCNLTVPMVGVMTFVICIVLFVVFSILIPDRQTPESPEQAP